MTDKVKPAATVARQLVRSARKAILCTTADQKKGIEGWPVGSLVTIATAWDGSPILLLSTLAHHTQNLMHDPRASLLVDGTEGYLNPQQGPRVGVMGLIKPTRDKGLYRRFLARHPSASVYADFGDFQFYKMRVERYHYVAGFARALWVSRKKTVLKRKDWVNIAASEEDILEHMNSDHREALRLYGTKILGYTGKHWNMIALDPEGMDLRCGNSLHRLEFDSLVIDAHDCRRALISLAAKAKKSYM